MHRGACWSRSIVTFSFEDQDGRLHMFNVHNKCAYLGSEIIGKYVLGEIQKTKIPHDESS